MTEQYVNLEDQAPFSCMSYLEEKKRQMNVYVYFFMIPDA